MTVSSIATTIKRKIPGKNFFGRVPGDAKGAFITMWIAVPIEATYGAIAAEPLGSKYAYLGILAALYTMIVTSLFSALAGSRGGMLAGPRPALALLVASLLGTLVGDPVFQTGGEPNVPLILAFLSLGIILAGFIQVLLGLLNLGKVIKYLPDPVYVGFLNGVAILILLAVLRPMLGLPKDVPWTDIEWLSTSFQPLTLVVALVTVGIYLYPPKVIEKRMPVLWAIATGYIVFYMLRAAFGSQYLGHTFGAITVNPPGFDLFHSVTTIIGNGEIRSKLALLVPFAFSIAILATLESLIVASAVDESTNSRHDSDREVLAQGVGNIAGALFGALPSAGAAGRCGPNVEGGARTRRSAIWYAVFVTVVLVWGAPVLQSIPRVVVASILFGIAWKMINPWSRTTPGKLLKDRSLTPSERSMTASHYAIMLLVALTALLTQLTYAVVVGVVASMIVFVQTVSKTIIRDISFGNVRRSMMVRGPTVAQFLEQQGEAIALVELEGALFFGSGERVVTVIEQLAHSRFIIIDFKHVTEIDGTGAKLIGQMLKRAKGTPIRFAFSGITVNSTREKSLHAMGLALQLPSELWFPMADGALEWAEDELIRSQNLKTVETDVTVALEETTLTKGMTPDQITTLKQHLDTFSIPKGQKVFTAGTDQNSLYVCLRGIVDIRLDSSGQQPGPRIASFAPGFVFGELAFLDNLPRSADAIARSSAEVMTLSRESFSKILVTNADLGTKILLNISLQMAQRLRTTTAANHDQWPASGGLQA